ncbi:gamma carbonic anhydrase family protein [Desulfobacterales bacterium HSG17]|nr:gamma carbonic anhydrase family protein [Desulfobacterales bacterium HSG17]
MIIPLEKKTPSFQDSVFIAPTAVVTGDVSVAEHSSIWFQSVLRGDGDRISVGRETNIQDLSMLHADPGFPLTIGDRVTVGHRVVLHGCSIGDDCLIGIGAIVMNGAQLGKGCVVAAGSVVLENTKVPPNTLIAGVPGIIKKQLGEDGIQKNKMIADVYVKRAIEYKELFLSNESG